VAVRILIVEDEQIIAADLRNQLRRMGHDVIGMAVSGQEAIDMAEQARPDLVLMDVQLDGKMSGTEAAKIIQDRAGSRVIFLTAFPGVFLRDPSQMTEPGICLGKPFSRPQLAAALGAALGDSDARHPGRVQ
jgi:two-component system, cell cycle sensor histidine kinase and response regulator CckA